MTGPETSGETGSETGLLVATRRLAILDELRIPYDDAPGVAGGRSWARLSPGEGGRSLHWFVGGDGDPAAGWSLGTVRIWGHVAPEATVARLVRSLPGDWSPASPIVDRAGATRSSMWRSSDGSTVLPFDPDELIANLRSERYLEAVGSSRRRGSALARRAYYALRPLLPRAAQIRLRRAYSRVQGRREFPHWPCEPALHDLVDLVRQAVADAAGRPVPFIGAWPKGRHWALVLTHDVETVAGRDAIARLQAVEEAAGYRSSWNLVPERYRVDESLVRRLKGAGCEVGVHGLRHDGRDLESLRVLKRRLPEIRRWADRWGAVGFRSPATHRVWAWMPQLGFDYDSSYPDSDPYEPIAGGCCSWLPFFNERMVELPITLPQDHTLFVILGRDGSLWRDKAELLRSRGGMALALTHPDYMFGDDRIGAYARLLHHFQDDATAWKPLPCEVSAWWRRRAETSLRLIGGSWRAVGPAENEATVAFVEPDLGRSPPSPPSVIPTWPNDPGAAPTSRRVGSAAGTAGW